MNPTQALQELGTQNAKDVTIKTIDNARGPDLPTTDKSNELRTAAIRGGTCVAECGGKTIGIDDSTAEALVKVGATDRRR